MLVLQSKRQDVFGIVKKQFAKKKTDLVVEFMMQTPPKKLRHSCCVQRSSVQGQKPYEFAVTLSIHDVDFRHDHNVPWNTGVKQTTRN